LQKKLKKERNSFEKEPEKIISFVLLGYYQNPFLLLPIFFFSMDLDIVVFQ